MSTSSPDMPLCSVRAASAARADAQETIVKASTSSSASKRFFIMIKPSFSQTRPRIDCVTMIL